VTRHPRTNADLIGFEVPGWQEIRELAIQAANVFTPLRTVGWDIGITDSEPVLIEGNVTWDTLSGDPRMGDLLNQLRSEV
jgi:hypothetical protein